MEASATARSCASEVGEAATQTEPPKVDAGVQAEPLDDASAPQLPPASARPASNRQQATAPPPPTPQVPGSRPATTASAAAAAAARPATKAGSSRPATQSRGKPSTAASAAAARRQPSQPLQPAITAEAFAESSGGQPGVLFVDNNRTWQQFQESSRQQRLQQGSECTPMVYSHNPDPRLRSWQSLEHARLHQLGLSSKLSRRYNVQRSRQFVPVGLHMRTLQPGGQAVRAALLPPLTEEFSAEAARKKNDVAPFLTCQKPTCGYFFSRDTENRKIRHGLSPADLPRWGADLLDRR